MKIALINNFPPLSGTGRVPYSLWEEFKKIPQVEADLICTHLMSWEDYRDPKNQGVKILHSFPYKEHEYLSRLMIYFWDPLRLPRGYDIYHITNHMLGRLGRFRRPVVVTAHDILQFKYREDMGNPVVSKIYNYFMDQSIKSLRHADRIICVSDYSRSQVIERLGVPKEKTVTVHNGLDHRLFKPMDRRAARQKLSLPLRAKILLHVGSELRRKNVAGLLEAFVKVKEQLGDLVLARVGEKTERVSKLTTEYKITSDVVYFQNVPEAELPLIYTAADVLVMPSFDEGFGFPIIEAQACGTPVITSSCSSMPEVAGGAALLVNPENPEDIASSILKVVELSPARRENLVAAGIENAWRFSWEKCARETVEVYFKIGEDHSPESSGEGMKPTQQFAPKARTERNRVPPRAESRGGNLSGGC